MLARSGVLPLAFSLLASNAAAIDLDVHNHGQPP
jgi:hypothetical protein